MDTRINTIKKILNDFVKSYNLNADSKLKVFFDNEQNSYMVLNIGWRRNKYIHSATIHIEIIDNKIWIQNDHTEEGIATSLIEAGIPKKEIILGFRHPKIRQYTEFAAA
ncbi:XisI protein [Desulfobacterales bacterium HSG17]|nr:XisI protein [Desulfobacterales bacterium HSG17]